MPLVENDYWIATITFVDNDDNRASFGVYLPGASLYADAYTDLSGIATAAAALSNAEVLSLSLTRNAHEDALNYATISEASDVERKAAFSFRGDNPVVRTRLELPSIDNTFVVEGTNVIDVNNATVQAFITALLTTAGIITNRGEVLTMVDGGPRKIHRGSSKG